MPTPEGPEKGDRTPLPLRVGRDFPEFGGEDQVSDPGSVPPDHFVELTNVENTGYRITDRAGLAKTVAAAFTGGAVRGVWDLETAEGEAASGTAITTGNGRVVPPPGAPPAPGATVTLQFNHVGVGSGPGNDDPNTWLCDPTPTTDANKITYITDADTTTGVYPRRTEWLQYFGIAAPAIADGLAISALKLHVTLSVVDSPREDGEVWAYGLVQIGNLNQDTGTATPVSQLIDGNTMVFTLSRPGGGSWKGADLKNATFQAGVFFVWGGSSNDFFRVVKMWLTYETP